MYLYIKIKEKKKKYLKEFSSWGNPSFLDKGIPKTLCILFIYIYIFIYIKIKEK